MRAIKTLAAMVLAAGPLAATPFAGAEPAPPPPACHNPDCTPGVAPRIVLGASCSNTTYYAFGVTDWGRLVFCGSPRRYEPRWFRSPEMHGVKEEGSMCTGYDGDVAQAPDGLFLTCLSKDGQPLWRFGGNP